MTQSGERLPATVVAPAAKPGTAAAGRREAEPNGGDEPPLLSVHGLVKHFTLPRDDFFGKRKVVRAVDGVSLSLREGEILGLVGESGCGKSTLGRTILQLIPPTDGAVILAGRNLAELQGDDLRAPLDRGGDRDHGPQHRVLWLLQRGHHGHLPTYELKEFLPVQNPGWFAGLGGPSIRAITYPRSSALSPLVPLDDPPSVVSRMMGTPRTR